VYGLDCFEESLVADYQYDVWRLAVSIALLVHDRIGHFPAPASGQEAHDLEQIQTEAVKAMAEGYLNAVFSFQKLPEAHSNQQQQQQQKGR